MQVEGGRVERSLLPCSRWLRTYFTEGQGLWRSDLLAGVTVACVLVPQAMAYATLAGLPTVHGLYAAVMPLIVYALLGTSLVLSVGPVSILSLLTAATVPPLVERSLGSYVHLAATLAFYSGLLQLVCGLLGVGVYAARVPPAMLQGFTTGAAFTVAVMQVRPLLGVAVAARRGPLLTLADVAQNLPSGHLATSALGLASLASLVALRRIGSLRNAAPLLMSVVASAAVITLGLEGEGVAVVGTFSAGLPPFDPLLPFSALPAMWGGVLAVSAASFIESFAIAKNVQVGGEGGQSVSPNAELVALGAANIAAAITGGYSVTGSFSRTAVNIDAGGKTPMASLVAAATLLAVVMFLQPALVALPLATLAAVVINAVAHLMDPSAPIGMFQRRAWRPLALWLTTCGGIIVLGVEQGMLAALLLCAVYEALDAVKARTGPGAHVDTTSSPIEKDGLRC